MIKTTKPRDSLPLLEGQPTESDACGCGGCGCGAADTGSTTMPAKPVSIDEEKPMITRDYAVSGMTCGHCVGAVSSELKSLDGVTDVHVAFVAGGTSSVTVTSTEPLDDGQVEAALDEAGDYQLV